MPFGTFQAALRRKKTKTPISKDTERRSEAEPSSSASSSDAPISSPESERRDFNVTLIARTQAQAEDFLCGMNQNMNAAAVGTGLSFYIPDLATMRRMSERRRKLDAFCRTFSQEDWTFPVDNDAGLTSFRFELSPSGVQRKSIRLNIHVATGIVSEPGQYDALWLLADGTSLLPERSQGDPYTLRLREILHAAPRWNSENPRPICLILTQFEGTGEKNGPWRDLRSSALPDTGWRDVFAGAAGPGTYPAVIAPRVYGALTYDRSDESHTPVLRLDARFQTYAPSACHIPFLYSLQTGIGSHKDDFFSDAVEGGLDRAVLRCFETQFSNPSWKPEILKGGDGE